MKCVILAAGQGTRLRPLAPSKPLAEVAGRPLLEHVMRLARAAGASAFLVVTGYEGARVEAALPAIAERTGAPAEAVRNPQWERPNGVSLLAAAGRLSGAFMLLMSDHLFDPAMLAAVTEARAGALTLGVDRRLDGPLLDLDDATKVETDGGGRIVRIGKALERYDAIDTGLFTATPELFEALRRGLAAGGGGSLSEGVQALADAGRAFAHDVSGGWWIDVDDEAAFRRAEASLTERLAGAVVTSRTG